MRITKVHLFGKPLANKVQAEQRLNKFKALPILSSDALSSVAYGTEEILHVLIIAGLAALNFSLPIAIAISCLLLILGASYWQTIHAYPNGGGAFTVAWENLGLAPGLIAASALLLDYLLTVAVSISAGIRAVTSAFPALMPIAEILCILAIVVITWINLRGAKESATVFAFPTYIFIGLLLFLIGNGLYQIHQGLLTPNLLSHREISPGLIKNTFDTFSLLLILRAFSAGCSALTGIECVANSVPVFQSPEVKNAKQTLLMMILLLMLMFLGITYLANYLKVIPLEEETVLSQISRTVFNTGFVYYCIQIATALILFLAANTAFTGFPRLASLLSENKFLPKQLTALGDRLSFSNGIILLAVLSSLLIIIFHANTHALIPLYSVGVFLAFSLSQLGMVKRWLKRRDKGWQWKTAINSLGFITTAIALCVIIESKFQEGAWAIVILIPIICSVFLKIRYHYKYVEKELEVTLDEAKAYLHRLEQVYPKVILPVSKMHRGTLAALEFARSVSPDVTAVLINHKQEETDKVQKIWKDLAPKIPLIILESPYRSTILPLKRFIQEQDRRDPELGLCMLVLPEAIPYRWWHYFLHNQRATLLKASLYYNRRHKGNTRIFVDVPYQLKR
ncbi:MAG: Potassium transporter KimA [Legionellaceae bacterium]